MAQTRVGAVRGESTAAWKANQEQQSYRRLLMGGTLSLGGVALLGIAMMGHRRHRVRLDE